MDVGGLEQELQIHRDVHGIPHVDAASERDAWFALGVLHGQDRLFQADIQRRLMWGRLSEWLGERTVGLDLFMAGLDLQRPAARMLEEASPDVVAMLEAYSQGLNSGASSLGKLPIEYRLLGVDFEPWTPLDCASVVFLQSWGLSANPHFETSALLLRDLSADDLDALFRHSKDPVPVDPAWEEVRTLDIAGFSKGFRSFTGALGGLPERGQASNNWIVGGERTASGLPIVANDPHLGQAVPSLWYPVDLRGGGLHVAGVSFAGSPTVVIGHNESIAWGLTNVMADYVDLAIVERVGEDSVRVEGQVQPLREVPVEVEVKGGSSATGSVWWTDLGPVISELSGTHLVVMRWHAFEIVDHTATVFRSLNLSTSVDEALQGARAPMAVAQNLVVADVQGDFAWQQVGSIPLREGHTGRVPYLASEEGSGWSGWWEELPGERGPERGYLWTANAAPDDTRAPAISTAYAAPWRHDRIGEVLEGLDKATVEDMARLQRDVFDRQAATVLPRVLEGYAPVDPEAQKCEAILRAWDFSATVESPAPTVWTVFQRQLSSAVVKARFGDVVGIYLQVAGPTSNILERSWALDAPELVEEAMKGTCVELGEVLGDDIEAWSWGHSHPLELTHPFADGRKLLSRWNMPVVPSAGTGSTVSATSHGWRGHPMPVAGMPSMRIVMPLADLGASTLVHPGGQSGQPGAKFFTSHFDAFVSGDTLPLWFDASDVRQNTAYTMTLRPE